MPYDGNPYDDVSINEALDQISDRCTDRTIRQAAYAIATRNGSYDESALKHGNPYVNIPVDEALSQLYDRCTDRTIRQAAFAIAANSGGDTYKIKDFSYFFANNCRFDEAGNISNLEENLNALEGSEDY